VGPVGRLSLSGALSVNRPAPAPSTSSYTQLYDGIAGMRGDSWNAGIAIPWANGGTGDWLDANQSPQGANAFASPVGPTALGQYDISGAGIVALVERWRASNRGALIRSGGTYFSFNSRLGSTPPTLRVTIGGVTTVCPCTCSGSISASQDASPALALGQQSLTIETGPSTILQFDLSALPTGTITDARIRLNVTGIYISGSSLNVYEVNTPRLLVLPSDFVGLETTDTGLVDSYGALDAGIGADSAVHMASAFEDGWGAQWSGLDGKAESTAYTWPDRAWAGNPAGVSNTRTKWQGKAVGRTLNDPAFGGRTSLTWYYLKEEDSVLDTVDSYGSRDGLEMTNRFVLKGKAEVDEAWFRWTLIPRDKPVPLQNTKFMSMLDFRAGYRVANGSFESVTGNGGNINRGYWMPNWLRPKQSYPAGTTSIVLSKAPPNCWTLISKGGGEKYYAYINAKNLGYDPEPFRRQHRFDSTQRGGEHIKSDANGEVVITNIEHKIAEGVWSPGLFENITTATPVQHDESKPEDYSSAFQALLAGGTVNFKNGEWGFFSGGSARLTAKTGWAAGYADPLRVKNGVSAGAASITVYRAYPNTLSVLRSGDKFWLNNYSGSTNPTQFTYSGPDLNADANGEFVVAMANCSPSLTMSVGADTYFDCGIAHKRCYDAIPQPYKDLWPLGIYLYPMDIEATSTTPLLLGSHSSGFPLLKADETYDVEIGIKLNTVTGPYDAYGNGVPVADGELWGEVNGVRCLHATGLKLRGHPDIKVSGVLCDTTLGGREYPRSPTGMGATMGPYVVATQRVGPMKKAARPQWLENLPTYTHYFIPNSDMITHLDRQPWIDAGMLSPTGGHNGFGYPYSRIGFSGGAARQEGAWLMSHGNAGPMGGAPGVATRCVDVIGISLLAETPRWEVLVPPVSFKRHWYRGEFQSGLNVITGQWEGGLNGCPMDPLDPTRRWNQLRYLSDTDLLNSMSDPPMPAVRTNPNTGQIAGLGDTPNSGHVYQCNQFIDARDTYIRFGCGNLQEGDEGHSQYFDSWTWADKRWVKKGFGRMMYTLDLESRPLDAGQGIPLDAWWTCQDILSGDVYYMILHAPTLSKRVIRWNQASLTQTDMGEPVISGVDFHQGSCAIDPINKRLVRWGMINGTTMGLVEYDVSGTTMVKTHTGAGVCSGPYVSILQDPIIIGSPSGGSGLSIIFSRLLNKYVIFKADGEFYTVERTAPGTFYVDRLPVADAAVPYVNANGTSKRRPRTDALDVTVGVSNRIAEFYDAGIIGYILSGADAVGLVKLR
jgi:hypothetical protein